MQRLREPLKYLLFTLLIIGAGLVIYGGYRYYDTNQQISKIDDQLKGMEEQVSNATSLEINPLAAADMALRRERIDIRNQRDDALRMLGIGIVLIGVVWLLWEVVLPRLKPRAVYDEGMPSL